MLKALSQQCSGWVSFTQREEGADVSKPKLEWAEKGEDEDFDAAEKYLSLLCSDAKAAALIRSLRNSEAVEHAAKDLLRAAHLPLLPSDESHVSEDLKRIQKGKALAPVLLIRGDVATGLPLIVADGYHRICAVCYFDESAPIPCRIADIVTPSRHG
jgi:hypothetical protein